MTTSWIRGAAVVAASAVLVLGPGTGVLADPGQDGRSTVGADPVGGDPVGVRPLGRSGAEGATVGVLVDPAGADRGAAATAAPRATTGVTWLPGSMARVLRGAETSGRRYAAHADELTRTRRGDAVALAHAALVAARAAHEVGDVVEPVTVQQLTDGVLRLSALLDRAGFSGVSIPSVTHAVRLPDGDVDPAPLRPSHDLALAASIDEAAAEVFRLSVDVEVAAREAEVGEPVGGPGDLRAPVGLAPVGTDADDDAAAGTGGDATGAGEGVERTDARGGADHGGGADAADAGDGAASADQPSVDQPGADQPGADQPGADQPGADQADADQADADQPSAGQPTGDQGDEGQAVGAGDGARGDAREGTAQDGASAYGSPADGQAPDDEADAADDGSAEAASLDALPRELVEGLAALEDAVAAATALLEADLFADDVAFLTPERARELVAAQGLDAADVAAWSLWQNGRIPLDQLCAVEFAPDARLRCDAAYALELLNVEYRAEFGEDISITDSYRSYEAQVSVKARKGWLAATPGRSNHGWGVAVDLAGMGGLGDFSSPRYRWMVEHGPAYGWHHPTGMRPGGSGPPEPWHFEFGGATRVGEVSTDGEAAAAPR